MLACGGQEAGDLLGKVTGGGGGDRPHTVNVPLVGSEMGGARGAVGRGSGSGPACCACVCGRCLSPGAGSAGPGPVPADSSVRLSASVGQPVLGLRSRGCSSESLEPNPRGADMEP